MKVELELHDVLQLTPSARLVYVGEGKAHSQKFYSARTVTGGLDPNGGGEWKVDKQDVALTEAQIARWLELKAQGKGSKL